MDAPQTKYIIMLPYMAQGHLIPFLELAHSILHHNPTVTITIATTPLNAAHLRSATANRPSPPSQIRLKPLPFNPSDHNLPPNAENTDSLPSSHIVKLLHASTALEPPFRQFISDVVSDKGSGTMVCIISDVLMGWANGVAKSFGVYNYTFCTTSAYGGFASFSILINLPHRNVAGDEWFVVPGFPESCKFKLTELNPHIRTADGKDVLSRFFREQVSLTLESKGWLCNTVEEIEALGLEVLRNFLRLPVWCVGPLIPIVKDSGSGMGMGSGVVGQRSGKKLGIRPESCMEYLDSHATGSVVYVSFGSENTIIESQMMELAKGLEESEKPFIWVVRPPIGFDPKGDFRPEWLPCGFVDRVGKRGLVVYGWAPQLEILCHRSTGAFLSHCGWNSVTESLSQGVPLIGWPMREIKRIMRRCWWSSWVFVW